MKVMLILGALLSGVFSYSFVSRSSKDSRTKLYLVKTKDKRGSDIHFGKDYRIDISKKKKCRDRQCLHQKDGECYDTFEEIKGIGMLKNCEGKCIHRNETCKDECDIDNDMCKHKDGHCVEMFPADEEKEWRSCDGVCIKPNAVCKGKCDGDYQCLQEDDGTCRKVSWEEDGKGLSNCDGKCIGQDYSCNDKCPGGRIIQAKPFDEQNNKFSSANGQFPHYGVEGRLGCW